MTEWQSDLDAFFEETEHREQERKVPAFERFVSDVVLPAFRELKQRLEQHDRTVTIRASPNAPVISVIFHGQEEIAYRIQERTLPDRQLPYAVVRMRERNGLRLITVESMIRGGAADYRIEDLTGEDVIRNFLQHYTSRVKPR